MWKIFAAGTPYNAESPEEGLEILSKAKLGNEVQFVRQVYMNNERAKKFGELAKSYDVPLSIHGSYYLNLANPGKVNDSKKRILSACERGGKMNAKCVVVHAGYYMGNEKKAYHNIEAALKEISKKAACPIGVEVMGKVKSFGTIDEVISLCDIENVVPVMDFAHWFARSQGHIDYKEVLDRFRKFKNLHSHFSCVNFGKSGEKNHLPLSEKAPDFKPLAEEIIKRKLDISVVCECPNPYLDGIKMRDILEKI